MTETDAPAVPGKDSVVLWRIRNVGPAEVALAPRPLLATGRWVHGPGEVGHSQRARELDTEAAIEVTWSPESCREYLLLERAQSHDVASRV